MAIFSIGNIFIYIYIYENRLEVEIQQSFVGVGMCNTRVVLHSYSYT